MNTRLVCLALCLLLPGCAAYQALPLEGGAPAHSLRLQVDAATLPFGVLAAHRFDPADGLDQTEVAMLAVANNPELRLERDGAAIAHAQAFAAGLLPDPQLSLSGDLHAGAGASAARAVGVDLDLSALLLHASTRAAAEGEAAKADLGLLWQEWQVASQARLLHVRQTQGEVLLTLMRQNEALQRERCRRTDQALARALVTSDVALAAQATLQDAQRQRFEQERALADNLADLHDLLGLQHAVALTLVAPEPVLAVDDGAAVQAALAQLAHRRPDLRALAAGYAAQDQRYRGAVLAQFPALNVGLTRARDNGSVLTASVGITLSLPFLNRNRGNLAIELASRQKLYDEYQVRLQAAANQVERVQAARALNLRQLGEIDATLPALAAAERNAASALAAGVGDVQAQANAHAAWLAKRIERVQQGQLLMEQAIALDTLLGIGASESEGK